MKLLVIVLNNVDTLENFLLELAQNGIRGATVIDSTGMASVLSHSDSDVPFLGSLSLFLNPAREHNKTIFIVLDDIQVKTVIDIVNKSLGGFRCKDSGILFTVPIDYVQGGSHI